jgi:hypothetical protein
MKIDRPPAMQQECAPVRWLDVSIAAWVAALGLAIAFSTATATAEAQQLPAAEASAVTPPRLETDAGPSVQFH